LPGRHGHRPDGACDGRPTRAAHSRRRYRPQFPRPGRARRARRPQSFRLPSPHQPSQR
jgi:hypothetical protein